MMFKKIALLVLTVAVLAGCATTSTKETPAKAQETTVEVAETVKTDKAWDRYQFLAVGDVPPIALCIDDDVVLLEGVDKEISTDLGMYFEENGQDLLMFYTVLKDTMPEDPDNLTAALANTILYSWNASGKQYDTDNLKFFNEQDVKAEFNADFGFSCPIFVEPVTEFAKAWNYMIVESFVKNGVGMVIRYTMFDDPGIIFNNDGSINVDGLYLKYYHTFMFLD